MKWFWLLLTAVALAALAAWAAPWVREDPGYVMFMLRGVAVETSLLFLLLAGSSVLLALWALLALLRMPWAMWREARRRRQRVRLGHGLLALSAGRYLRAERLLSSSGNDPQLQVPALIEAARATLAQGEEERAEDYLRSAELLPAGTLAVGLFRAERLLSSGDHATAMVVLDGLDARPSQAPLLALLRLRALRAAGRLGEALAELPELRRSRLLDAGELRRIERELEIDVLTAASDEATLKAAWKHAPRPLRARSEVLAAYARRALALNCPELARAALESALDKRWDEALIRIYGELPNSFAEAALRRCERWLADHSQSPGLLLTLAHYCRVQRLWGKAEDYLRASLAHAPCSRAWEELALVREALGDNAGAISSLHNALAVQRDQKPLNVPQLQRNETDDAVLVDESRDPQGMPQLQPPG